MDNRIANYLATFRSQLASLNRAEHKTVWENQPPLKFTAKAAEAKTLTNELAGLFSLQSAGTTGTTADKAREEKELENEAYKLGRALVSYARDQANETLAAQFDRPISGWTRLADEALLQDARRLHADVDAIVNGTDALNAAEYGLDADALASLQKETDDFEGHIVAPQEAIANRSVLTDSLYPKSRQVRAKFTELDDFLPQFQVTPEGAAFVAAFQAVTQIIDRGHRSAPADGDEETGSGGEEEG